VTIACIGCPGGLLQVDFVGSRQVKGQIKDVCAKLLHNSLTNPDGPDAVAAFIKTR
jgi:hypothetical protein